MMASMPDKLPENIDLTWIGRTLLKMQSEMRDGFAELKRQGVEDRSLLGDVAYAVGLEPTKAQLKREDVEQQTRERLDKLEGKVCPPAD